MCKRWFEIAQRKARKIERAKARQTWLMIEQQGAKERFMCRNVFAPRRSRGSRED